MILEKELTEGNEDKVGIQKNCLLLILPKLKPIFSLSLHYNDIYLYVHVTLICKFIAFDKLFPNYFYLESVFKTFVNDEMNKVSLTGTVYDLSTYYGLIYVEEGH